MVTSSSRYSAAAAAFGLLVGAGLCPAEDSEVVRLQTLVAELTMRNDLLQKDLVASNRAEKEASDQLRQITLRLEALGKNLLDGGEDRLVRSAADLQIANERMASVEQAAGNLVSAVQNYIRKAVISDPDARLLVETSVRELDEALGLRQKPRPDVRSGTLQKSKIVSIDSESGMLVLNVGEIHGARIGMTFRLARGSAAYGKAIVADVRKNVCGLFVDSPDPTPTAPQIGDLALLETQPSQ